MNDHPGVTPPGGTGRDDDGDGPAAGRPEADPGPAAQAPAEGPEADGAANGSAAGDTGLPRKSNRPEGYEPL